MTKKSDYFGLSYLTSVILAIIPVTALVCGIITRINENNPLAALLRVFLGWNAVWIADLVLMLLSKRILRIVNR